MNTLDTVRLKVRAISTLITAWAKRYWWIILIAVFVAWLMIRMAALYASVGSLRVDMDNIRASYSRNDLFVLTTNLETTADDVSTLAVFMRFLRPFEALPLIGGDLTATRILTMQAHDIFSVIKPHLVFSSDPFTPTTSWSLIGLSEREYVAAGNALPSAFEFHDFVERVKTASIAIKESRNRHTAVRVAPIMSYLDAKLDALIPRLGYWDQGWFFARYLFGTPSPKNILVLLVNEGERRPGGGIVTAYAVVEVRQGAINFIAYNDTYNFDRAHNLKGNDQLRNVFVGDFTSGAKRAEALVKLPDGRSADVVVAVTTKFFVDLFDHVQGFQPTDAHSIDPRFSDFTVLQKRALVEALEQEVHFKWIERGLRADEKKEILHNLGLSPLAKGLQFTLQEVFSMGDLLHKALVERTLMLYSAHADLEKGITAAHWDGTPQPFSANQIRVADNNTAGAWNKTDRSIARTYTYTVAEQNSAWDTRLAIEYAHQGLDLTKIYDYHDTAIVYAPAGSRLLSKKPYTSTMRADGSMAFSVPIHLRAGQTTRVEFNYTTPKSSTDGFSLQWVREPGVPDPQPEPHVDITVRLMSPIKEVQSNVPVHISYGQSVFHYVGSLATDLNFSLIKK